jgi:hypothetical protein
VEVGEKVGGQEGEALIHTAGVGFTNGLHWAVVGSTVIVAIGLVCAAAMIPRKAEVHPEHRRPAGGV